MNGSIKIKSSGQQGQALALAIIVVAITGLLAVPVLSLSSSVLHRSAASRTTLTEQYSVDAGTEDAIWRITFNDDGFLNKWTPYTITINGADTAIEVEPHIIEPVPVPDPPPPNSGIEVLLWTSIESMEIDLLSSTVTMTMHIWDGLGGADPTIEQLVEVLPKGFQFVPGSLACEDSCNNLVWSAGQEHGEPLSIAELNNALTVSCMDSCQKTLTGADPWDLAAKPNACPSLTRSDSGEDYQRLEWNWPGNEKAQIVDGQEVKISFQMTPPETLDLTALPLSDNPWILTRPNQCNDGGSEQLQAGRPLEISGSLIALITATQGKTTLTSLVEFDFAEPGPELGIEIQSQRYGRSEEP